VSEPDKKNKFGHEMRLLLASLLSVGVILLWARFFAPKQPVVPPLPNKAVQTGSNTAGSASGSAKSASGATPSSTAITPASPVNVSPRGESNERTIIVENDLYRVEFSNRGAVVKSWQLKKYFDDAKPPRVLDVVHAEAAQQTGGWPFALVLNDGDLGNTINGALFQASSQAASISAPADLEFDWSDGHTEVSKRFHFDHSYVVRVETSVKSNGGPVTGGVGWLGGFGDLTVSNPIPIETVSAFYSENGKLTTIPAKKLEGPEKFGNGIWQGGKEWVGIEDRYFAVAFLPASGVTGGQLETRYWQVPRDVQQDGKQAQEPVPQLATASAAKPLALRVYVGPKDYDDLKKMNPPLHSLVNFGWLEIISDPLFHGLKWLHKYVPNWGWSIVILTLIINMLLFPLKFQGYKTSLKMQRVAPEIKQIQDKYKKYSMRDPRKQEMNKEVMAVYSREGINPIGGCVPQLLQMPIWFGLYRALQGTIEMRHAPWFGWITDLSAKDPYYILPILMGVSMYLATKMTPMTSTDPQQQTMMKVMPIGMAAMFVVIPYPSGLAVYILTSSLVGILQQYWLNRAHPVQVPAKALKPRKA
jgi:YidC/Oxa1 family membrane protein insertase